MASSSGEHNFDMRKENGDRSETAQTIHTLEIFFFPHGSAIATIPGSRKYQSGDQIAYQLRHEMIWQFIKHLPQSLSLNFRRQRITGMIERQGREHEQRLAAQGTMFFQTTCAIFLDPSGLT
jgi:hypothetical protein